MHKTIKQLSIFASVAIIGLSSCKKIEGPGGRASISGNVSGVITNNSTPTAETTTITCTPGAVIDDNDYWLINAANGNQYYIWYDNSNWVGGDPALSGRIGIKVDYNFSQSNAVIASNTSAAMNALASSDFTIVLNNDILTITNVGIGQVPDAEDMTSPMAIDVQTQGAGSTGSGSTATVPIVDERVYIIYGDDDYYSDIARTDASGNYHFNYLEEGNYRLYAFSINTNGIKEQIEVTVEIASKKEEAIAPDLVLMK
ncbi:MAG: hypothetical protein COA33_014620 [Fluviicola sp.]|nr:hypothetical protein [Fluviicola sp.]